MMGNLIKKEVKELFTRSTLLSMVFVALLFGVLGTSVGNIGEQLQQKPIIGVIDSDTGNLSQVAVSILNQRATIVYNGDNVQDGLTNVRAANGAALLLIPQNFSSNVYANLTGQIDVYWIMNGAGVLDTIPASAVEGLIQSVNQALSTQLIEQDSSLNAALILHPTATNESTLFKGKEIVGVSPSAIASALSSQAFVIPVVILMLITMSGGMILSSMGLEKENKTLETLLTLPVKRSYIVISKLMGSAIVGLLMAGIYLVGFTFYINAFSGSGTALADIGLTLHVSDYALMGVSLFFALLAGLALSLILGLFANDYKSAQTLTFPIIALALIPMFVLIFKDFDTLPLALKVALFAIPFSEPMMAPRALMFGDYTLVLAGILYTALFSAACIAIAVWFFRTDRLLTGTTKRGGLLRLRGRKRERG